MANISKKNIEYFVSKLNFDNLKDKAAFLNWLIINEFIIEDENLLWNENKNIWEKIIPDIYKMNETFRSFIDFLFMFDRFNIKKILLGCILLFNK